MKKEELKRLKAGLLALSLCLTLGSCKVKSKEEQTQEGAIVIFIEGKALIYSGEYNMFVGEDYTRVGGNMLKYSEITRFSSGTNAVQVKSKEDAIELAEAIVGEENIIYLDYKDEDIELTYSKKIK